MFWKALDLGYRMNKILVLGFLAEKIKQKKHNIWSDIEAVFTKLQMKDKRKVLGKFGYETKAKCFYLQKRRIAPSPTSDLVG